MSRWAQLDLMVWSGPAGLHHILVLDHHFLFDDPWLKPCDGAYKIVLQKIRKWNRGKLNPRPPAYSAVHVQEQWFRRDLVIEILSWVRARRCPRWFRTWILIFYFLAVDRPTSTSRYYINLNLNIRNASCDPHWLFASQEFDFAFSA